MSKSIEDYFVEIAELGRYDPRRRLVEDYLLDMFDKDLINKTREVVLARQELNIYYGKNFQYYPTFLIEELYYKEYMRKSNSYDLSDIVQLKYLDSIKKLRSVCTTFLDYSEDIPYSSVMPFEVMLEDILKVNKKFLNEFVRIKRGDTMTFELLHTLTYLLQRMCKQYPKIDRSPLEIVSKTINSMNMESYKEVMYFLDTYKPGNIYRERYIQSRMQDEYQFFYWFNPTKQDYMKKRIKLIAEKEITNKEIKESLLNLSRELDYESIPDDNLTNGYLVLKNYYILVEYDLDECINIFLSRDVVQAIDLSEFFLKITEYDNITTILMKDLTVLRMGLLNSSQRQKSIEQGSMTVTYSHRVEEYMERLKSFLDTLYKYKILTKYEREDLFSEYTEDIEL